MKQKTVIVIAGPTGVGKTAAAIRLASHLQTSIISADSRQCFRELSIGVSRPSPEELNAVPHYFIASHSIYDEVDAAAFEGLALGWAEQIFRTNDYVIIAGGTGLYIKAFCEGLDDIPATDISIREAIRKEYAEKGLSWLQEEVRVTDPGFYSSGEILNPHRLMRALEVKKATGRSIGSFQLKQKKERPFSIIKIGLELPRETLYAQINQRVNRMMEAGQLQEVESLINDRAQQALQTVGYRELFEYFDGSLSLDKAVDLIKQHTRNYAKRQLTWFKKEQDMHWLAPNDWQGMRMITES